MAMSDPRKTRPAGENGAGFAAEEDPLVELARIVSEDGGFARRGDKARPPAREEARVQATAPAPASPKHVPAPNLSATLEAELLQELESSFAARNKPVAPPAARPAAASGGSVQPAARPRAPQPVTQGRPTVTPLRPQQIAPEASDDADADELLRSIEEQLGQFEKHTKSARSAAGSEGQERGVEAVKAQPSPTPDPVDEWRPRRGARVHPVGEEADVASGHPQSAPTIPPGARPDYRFRGPAVDAREAELRAANDVEAMAERLRPNVQISELAAARRAELKPIPIADNTPGKEKSEASEAGTKRTTRPTIAAVKEFQRDARGTLHEHENGSAADHVARGLADVETEISRELEPRYADPSFGGRAHQDETDGDEAPRVAAVAAAREQIGRAAPRDATRRRRAGARGRAFLTTAASLVIVAAVGAAAAYYMNSGESVSSGPPPVIAAPEGAVKIEPQQQATAEGETVGEAVYNRVAGNAPETEEQVVDSAEEPKEIARIVLPSPTDNDDALVRSVDEGGAAAAADAAAPPAATGEADAVTDDIGPRRVQTFVVRPDGTIVATDKTAPQPDPAPAQQQQLAAQTQQIEPVPVATVAIGTASGASPVSSAAAPAVAAAEPAPAAAELSQPEVPLAEPPVPDPQVAAVAPEVPAAAETAPALESSPAAGEGYVVQVSSQRSREQAEASFSDMQSRYASILGGLSASVQEADLGSKGIYYRVRVGPYGTRDEAIALCEQLKGAGGSCFVTQ